MKDIKNIFFDLDHTLWDFDKNSDLTFYKILETNNIKIDVSIFLHAYHPINRNYWNLYREDKVTKQHLRFYRLSDTFNQLNFNIDDEMINKLAVDYIEHLSDFNHLIPDSILILEELKSRYNMHIITNGFKEVQQRKLIKSGLMVYFQTITISEDVGVKKPDKFIFNHAISKANAKIENSIMIGDNYNADILGANNIGMKSIYFNFHNTQENDKKDIYIIQYLKQILDILWLNSLPDYFV